MTQQESIADPVHLFHLHADLPLDGTFQTGLLTGDGSHVYVLDTGVRMSHRNFRERVGESASMLGG